ncbi:MAG: DUF4373 domain-containing protein [Bacteroidaceae bacterium]|nr:DUF4373 domain-containing protein [Bacteroidaceae bacterium]
MAKKGLDYFSFDVNFFDNDKVALIEAEFGMKGVFILLKLLCKIYSEGYYCEWGEDQCLLFTSRKLKPSIPDLTAKFTQQVVESLVKRNFFNKDLYDKHSILTSRNIQERYYEVAKRRQKNDFDTAFWLLTNNKNVDRNAENVDRNAENVDIFSQRKVKESKVKESKYNLPQEDINYNNSNTHTRGGGKNLYFELGKWAHIREDVWDAVAISGFFQNEYTQYYHEWLQLSEEQKRDYSLKDLNLYLRSQCGELNTDRYHAICWCKENLSDLDYREIYGFVVAKPQALTELLFCIREIRKGKIAQPGAFILSKLRKI